MAIFGKGLARLFRKAEIDPTRILSEPLMHVPPNERAAAMNFNYDAFHGTAGKPVRLQNFNEFDPGQSSSHYQLGDAKNPVFAFSQDPALASKYAMSAGSDWRESAAFDEFDKDPRRLDIKARRQELGSNKADGMLADVLSEHRRTAKGGEYVMPVKLRMENPYVVENTGGFSPTKYQEYIADARKGAHDGLILKDAYDSPYGFAAPHKGDNYMVFSPSQVRSRFAEFDPAKKDSGDLLASGLGAATIGGGLAYGASQDQADASPLSGFGKGLRGMFGKAAEKAPAIAERGAIDPLAQASWDRSSAALNARRTFDIRAQDAADPHATTSVIKNPTETDLSRLSRPVFGRPQGNGLLRYIADKNGNVFAFRGYDATHDDAALALRAQGEPLDGYSASGEGRSTDHLKGTIYRNDDGSFSYGNYGPGPDPGPRPVSELLSPGATRPTPSSLQASWDRDSNALNAPGRFAAARGDNPTRMGAPIAGKFDGVAPTENEQRLQRARDQGFDVDNVLYHGMSGPMRGDGLRTGSAREKGLFLTSDPEIANHYAADGGNLRPDGSFAYGDGAAVYPVYARNGARIGGPEAETVVNDARNVRSVHAAFGPSKINSKDLLASALLGAGVAGAAGVAGSQQESDASILGPLAKTADHAALAAAREMHAGGATRDAIWNQTGWFKGPDDKWRFEADDRGAQMQPGSLFKKRGALSDYLTDADVGGAYPHLSDIPTTRGGEGASYGPDAGIQFSSGNARSKILHERQHAIQQAEGFTRGANSALPPFRFDSPALQSRWDDIMAEKRGIMDAVNITDLRGRARRGAVGGNEKPFLDRYNELQAEQDFIMPFTLSNGETYRRTAGEVEARNVQARRNFTPEQRKARPPWTTQDVPDHKQLLAGALGLGAFGATTVGGQGKALAANLLNKHAPPHGADDPVQVPSAVDAQLGDYGRKHYADITSSSSDFDRRLKYDPLGTLASGAYDTVHGMADSLGQDIVGAAHLDPRRMASLATWGADGVGGLLDTDALFDTADRITANGQRPRGNALALALAQHRNRR